MEWNQTLKGLIAAVGIGLMIGVIRERSTKPELSIAGIRTHALIAVLGSLTWILGLVPFVATLTVVGALAVASYIKTADKDPGLTSEVTIVVTFILAALAHNDVMLAAALGVLCAILLQAKSSIHKVSRELITERELGEALLILASSLIVLPLLPSGPVDPWGAIDLNTTWRIVVLIMAMGMFGHVARRALGDKFGLPVAGFFSGFASSTAAIAGFGQRVKADASLALPASVAALLANLASFILFCGVIGTVSPKLLATSVIPFVAASLALLIVSGIYFRAHKNVKDVYNQPTGSSFKLSHALIIAIAISSISLLSIWLNKLVGSEGVLVALSIVSMAELHAAAVSLGQLAVNEEISLKTAEWGIVGMIGASSIAKSVLAFMSGGKKYGKQVSVGLIAMMIVLVAGTILF